MPGENLDLSSWGREPEPNPRDGAGAPVQRPRFVGIHFQCCRVYSRVFVNQQGTAYVGNCPRLWAESDIENRAGRNGCPFFYGRLRCWVTFVPSGRH